MANSLCTSQEGLVDIWLALVPSEPGENGGGSNLCRRTHSTIPLVEKGDGTKLPTTVQILCALDIQILTRAGRKHVL